jgi:predicted Zn-dependent peptidase
MKRCSIRRASSPLLAALLVAVTLSGACAPTRPPLPPPPPPTAVAQLERWKNPPPFASDRPLTELKLDTTRVRLDNGLGLTLIARPGTKVTSVVLWVPGAADWTDGPVSLMAEALYAGTRVGAHTMINPRLDMQAIGVATSAAGSTFRWNVLPDATRKAVELLGAFVTHPTFEPAETRTKLGAAIDAIQRFSRGQGNLGRVAQGAFIGSLPTPEEDALALIRLKFEDFSAIHACTMRPDGAELVVVGPSRAEDVAAWSKAAFGEWRGGPPEAGSACERWKVGRPGVDTNIRPLSRTQLAIAYVQQPEPWVSILLPAPSVRSEDYITYLLLSRALGWRSLTQPDTLRHTGATYGIDAQLNDEFRNFSLLELTGQVEPSRARESIKSLVQDNWGLGGTLTEAELDSAKRMFRTELLTALASNPRLAWRVLWLLRQGVDPRELGAWLDGVMRIDVTRGRDVAQRWLKDAKPSIIVASAPQKLVSGLGLDVHLRELTFTKDPQAKRKVGGSATP